MKKYVILRCSVCDRTKSNLIDLTHYAPDKCTITLGCEGRLAPVGYSSSSRADGAIPSGIQNWVPRGTVLKQTVSLQEDTLVQLSTGSKKQAVLAVLGDFSSAATAVLTFTTEQQTPKDYRQYTFRKAGAFNIVNGVEDGANKKVLRYSIIGTTPDVVEVFVNGVKRNFGTGPDDYSLYDGTSGSTVPPNTILFNSIVTGSSTQIDVIVSKRPTTESFEFLFTRMIDDDSRVGTGAWEDVDKVSSVSFGARSLFYLDFSELSVPVDKKFLVPTLVVNDGVQQSISLTDASFLLSRSGVHTTIDRLRSVHIPLSAVSETYLVSKTVQSERVLLAPEAAVKETFPPFEVLRFNTPALVKTNLTGVDDSYEIENSKIIGPDE